VHTGPAQADELVRHDRTMCAAKLCLTTYLQYCTLSLSRCTGLLDSGLWPVCCVTVWPTLWTGDCAVTCELCVADRSEDKSTVECSSAALG
jgi:hypothetical protein